MLSVADMFNMAANSTSVDLYHKGKYRGMLFVTQCEAEQPVDMVCHDGSQGYVAAYPPTKLKYSKSLPASWPPNISYPPRPHYLPNPSHPCHPPQMNIRASKIPANYQPPYQPLVNAARALETARTRDRAVTNPEKMRDEKTKSRDTNRNRSNLLRKASEGASKVGLGSISEGLDKLGQSNAMGAIGSIVHRATKTSRGWSLGDQLDRLAKK